MTQGLIHIYCGDGKGKTSAAVGLAVRAAGCGVKVLFARFLKNEDSGELRILDEIPGIEVIHTVFTVHSQNMRRRKPGSCTAVCGSTSWRKQAQVIMVSLLWTSSWRRTITD